MASLQITFELKQSQLVFDIHAAMQAYNENYHCTIDGNKWDYQWLSLQQLHQFLLNNKSNLHVHIQDLQLQIILPIGPTNRAIYLPIISRNSENLSKLLEESLRLLILQGQQVSVKGQQESIKVNTQIEQMIDSCLKNKQLLQQSQNRIQVLSSQLPPINQQLLKLNRQVLAIDEEIIACKRGLQLQQYREQTSAQNREERRRNMHVSELKKYNHPQIQNIINKEWNEISKINIAEVQVKTMKFVQIFNLLQEIRLTKVLLRKIQGLHSLTHLRILDLSQNIIEKIQGLNNNSQIKQVYLQHNKISKLQNIFHLCHLQVLALSDNLIEEIPKEIKMISNLTELRLISNNINYLPYQMLDLKKLKVFSILGNPCFRQTHKSKDIINRLFIAQVLTCCSVF